MNWRDYPGDPALADFVALEAGGARLLVRRGYEAWARTLAGEAAPAGAEWVGGGRAPHPLVPLPGGGRALVRGYRRGGLVRHLVRERYLGGHRAFAEARATERARAGGVRVPQVLAAVERPAGVGYTARLATLWIEGARELIGWLAAGEPAARAAVLAEAGRQVALMHGAGVAHPDLNLRNLLVVEGAEAGSAVVYLLDFDRARLHAGPVPGQRRARDVRRLARSARKLAAPIGGDGWRAFAAGYGAEWPLGGELEAAGRG